MAIVLVLYTYIRIPPKKTLPQIFDRNMGKSRTPDVTNSQQREHYTNYQSDNTDNNLQQSLNTASEPNLHNTSHQSEVT